MVWAALRPDTVQMSVRSKRVIRFPEYNLQPPPTTMILGAGIVAFLCTEIRQSLMEEVKDSGTEEDEKN
jgi:hypothetical protein